MLQSGGLGTQHGSSSSLDIKLTPCTACLCPQEVCYLCLQQEQRRLRAAMLEEKEKKERAERAELQDWQARMAALSQVGGSWPHQQWCGHGAVQGTHAFFHKHKRKKLAPLPSGPERCSPRRYVLVRDEKAERAVLHSGGQQQSSGDTSSQNAFLLLLS